MGFVSNSVKTKWLSVLLNIIGYLFFGLAVICAGLACVAGFVQLITFKWGELLLSLVIGCVAGYLLFLPIPALASALRRGKYKRNPLVKEIVSYCKKNGIVGIQCFSDRVRFFTALEGEEYCKDGSETIHEKDQRSGQITEKTDIRPHAWRCYDNPPSLAGTLKFAERGYPELPDINIFAEALASLLGDCAVASHSTSVQYSYYRYDRSTGNQTRVNHTTHNYKDAFVYKKSALKKLKQEKKQQAKAAAASLKQQSRNSNSWE